MKKYFVILFLIAGSLSISGNEIVKKTIKTVLTDGTTLTSDLFLPVGEGPFPVILMRTPYSKRQREVDGVEWAKNGYAAVIQDVRGKWESEGEFFPFKNELDDGIETIDWIAKQEWCNGDIGLFGTSYSGFTALTLAAKGHPALKSIFVLSGWLDEADVINPGGANHHMLNLAWMLHEFNKTKRPLNEFNFNEIFSHLPISNVFESIGFSNIPWDTRSLIKELNSMKNLSAENITVPVFTLSGWNDFVVDASVNVHKLLMNNNSKNKLMVGPWAHDQAINGQYQVGDENFQDVAEMGRQKINSMITNWFDYSIYEKENDLSEMKSYKLFLMGSNKWVQFDKMPDAQIHSETLYLNSNGFSNSINGDGKLYQNVSDENSFSKFLFDPNNPVPTNGGANFHWFRNWLGIKDQAEIEKREDVLVYSSEILNNDITILGEVNVELYVETEGLDTDFTAKLVEAKPNGYARIVDESIIRLSQCKELKNEQIIPGKVYKVNINLGTIGMTFGKGSEIRLEVSSSNFPKYDRNPNTGDDVHTATELKAVNQKVYHGKEYPSNLKFVVLK